MGTHPIFESDFDCLTDSKSKKKSQWPLSKLQSSRKLATMKSRTTAEAKTKLRRSRLTLVETKPPTRVTKVVVDNRNQRKRREKRWRNSLFVPFPASTAFV